MQAGRAYGVTKLQARFGYTLHRHSSDPVRSGSGSRFRPPDFTALRLVWAPFRNAAA